MDFLLFNGISETEMTAGGSQVFGLKEGITKNLGRTDILFPSVRR